MKIDKTKFKNGIWYTDENMNVIPTEHVAEQPKGAVYACVCFPLEITTNVYKIRKDGGYGGDDQIITQHTSLSRNSGKLAVAMVNSGDYDLYDALTVLATACERCMNVLWNKYLPEEDGYEEYSEEWYKAGTECEFCKEEK